MHPDTMNPTDLPMLARPWGHDSHRVGNVWRDGGLPGVVTVLEPSDDGPGGPRRIALVKALAGQLGKLAAEDGGRYGPTDLHLAIATVATDLDAAVLRFATLGSSGTALAAMGPLTRLEDDARRTPPVGFDLLTERQRAQALSALAAAAHLARLALAERADLVAVRRFAEALAFARNIDGRQDVHRFGETIAAAVRVAVDPCFARWPATAFDPRPGAA